MGRNLRVRNARTGAPILCHSTDPDRNGDRMTGELSRGNEMPDVFLQRSRWLEPLHENILQAGQHFHYSAPNELLQGTRDIWHKFLGKVEILHRGKLK